MTDKISVTFGQIAGVPGYHYHEGILTSVNGEQQVTQSGPSVPLGQVGYAAAAANILAGIGQPFGTIIGGTTEVPPNTEQTNLPSVTVLQGPNLNDVTSVMQYDEGVLASSKIPYGPVDQNSNTVATTILGLT